MQEDAPLCENAQETLTVSPYKAYVEVIADFSSDGRMKPLRVCRILGKKVELYYEENGFWFVNRKTPRT